MGFPSSFARCVVAAYADCSLSLRSMGWAPGGRRSMGWAPGGSPSPTSIRRRSASGRQINGATRCCTPFDGVELDGRQPKQSLHDNIICLSALRPPPSRSLAPVECIAGHRLVGEACLDFWKTALNRSDPVSQPRADAARRIDIDLLAHARRAAILDAKQLSNVDPQ